MSIKMYDLNTYSNLRGSAINICPCIDVSVSMLEYLQKKWGSVPTPEPANNHK